MAAWLMMDSYRVSLLSSALRVWGSLCSVPAKVYGSDLNPHPPGACFTLPVVGLDRVSTRPKTYIQTQ